MSDVILNEGRGWLICQEIGVKEQISSQNGKGVTEKMFGTPDCFPMNIWKLMEHMLCYRARLYTVEWRYNDVLWDDQVLT